MGDFSSEGVWSALDPAALIVEEAQVIVHEAGQPDVIGDFSRPDVLTRKDLTEIDLASCEAQAAALGDGDRHVVERIVQLLQAGIGPQRGRVELSGVAHRDGRLYYYGDLPLGSLSRVTAFIDGVALRRS
jgi:hypothetical protein